MKGSSYGKVAVLMGGNSAERAVSLISGQAVLDALNGQGIEACGLDPAAGLLPQLAAGDFDRVFVALHGRGGEDGTVQGLLEYLDLPYTGSGVMASALCMDKVRTKQLWRGVGLPTPDFLLLGADCRPAQVVAQLGLPLMVKPVLEGSSIGMSKVTRPEDLGAAVALAQRQTGLAFAETWITGAEYTVAIVGPETLPSIRLETPRVFYDYQAKYEAEDTRYFCPGGLSEEQESELRELAWRAYQALGCEGWGRIDFMQDRQERFWLIEANTVPGLTGHSLVPMAARARGWEFPQLIRRILDESVSRTLLRPGRPQGGEI